MHHWVSLPFTHIRRTYTAQNYRSLFFRTFIPPPRPGEGPSSQQYGYVPFVSTADHFMPHFAHATSSSAPTGEPFMWFPPNDMHIFDPYHPFHIGYSRDDLLLSLQLQQDMLCRKITELERIPRPPSCTCQSPFTTPPAPLQFYPKFGAHFLTMEKQIAYLLRVVHALEEDLTHLRRLLFIPPPPPPSA
ncbi:hypothetical protein Hanom_Chr13g01196851 [Helianthus anomalus]